MKNIKPTSKITDSLLLLIVALLFYSYRLAQNPVWLDETLIHLAAQRGLERLLFYSSIGPHPPFYYLLQWVLAGMGEWQTEWAWRWFPMLCGTLTIPLIYIVMRRLTNRLSAFLSASLFLFAPMHLYFSQESRPYTFLILLVTISLFQLMRVQRCPEQKNEWIRLGILSIVGLYSGYSYAFIIMGQFLYLTLVLGQWRRGILTGSIVLLLAGLPLLRSATPTLNFLLDKNVDSPALTFGRMVQSLLVMEPLRYGLHWGHDWIPLLFGLLLVIALWHIIQTTNSTINDAKLNLYHILQIVLPPLIFFTVCTPLLDIRLPLKDAKQFIVLYPSFFSLVALSLEQIGRLRPKMLGAVLSILVCSIIFVSDAQGILNYWQTNKSPEGLAIRQLQNELTPEDGIISLHYGPSASLSFYMPDQPFYIPPRRGDRTKNEFQIYLDGDWNNEPRPLAEILTKHPRFWIFHRYELLESTQTFLLDACTQKRSETYGPFISSLYHCP